MVFSCSTVAYLVSNAVIGHISNKARRGRDRSGLHLGTWFDVPAAGPCAVCLLRATADHRFVCLDVFLGFSVGGITVPVETLMTKLVVCYYHGRGQSIQVSHSSDSLAAMSGFAVTCGAIAGHVSRRVLVDINLKCGGAVHIEGFFQEGERESQQFGPLYSQLFVLDLSLLFRCVWGSYACVLLGRVSGSMARRAGSRIRGFGDVSHH